MEKKDKERDDCSKAAHFDCTPNDTVLFPQTLYIYINVYVYTIASKVKDRNLFIILYMKYALIYFYRTTKIIILQEMFRTNRGTNGERNIKKKEDCSFFSVLVLFFVNNYIFIISSYFTNTSIEHYYPHCIKEKKKKKKH